MPADPLLQVRDLTRLYHRPSWFGRPTLAHTALDGVSFTLERGQTLAVIGPSGSGKSTLARCLAQFETPTSGQILFEGSPLSPARRLEIQLIVQQPAASLNPRFTAAEIVEEPLVIQGVGTQSERRERAARALELTGIARTALSKRSHEFSGGERQRLAIARAVVGEPKLLILDESFNGLDPGLAAQIAALLGDLQERLGVSYLLISHDLTLVAGIAREIAVMEAGRIVEQAPAAILTSRPEHPLTRELLLASRALEGGAA
ncbi:MAG: ATP-binding cassette domain-containing protein [Candidatus Solibacter sp.]